jgi:hypothetical protein
MRKYGLKQGCRVNFVESEGTRACRKELDISFVDYALTLTKAVNGQLLTTDSELTKTRDFDVRNFPI